MRFLKQLVAVVAIAFLGGQAVGAVSGNPWLTLPLGALTAVLAILVYGWAVRRTEHRDPAEVARPGAGRRLALGTLLGCGMFAVVIANIWFLGGYHVHGLGSAGGAIGLPGFMAAAAELLFRGVLLRIIEERTGTSAKLPTRAAGDRPGARARACWISSRSI